MNINNYDKHLFRRIQISRSLMTKIEGLKFYSLILISIMLIGALNFYIAFSSYTNIVTIRNSGTITTILPLYVDGKYIKNSMNQTVILKGVNKVEFCDDPDGIWMDDTLWSDANVKAEVDAMKNWGFNVIRCHFSVELWKYNIGPNSRHPASPYCVLSAREAIKRFLNIAAEKGIYVILDPYSVRCFWTDGEQDPLPYPPYQTSPGAQNIIANEQEFVAFWRSVASELKEYPNVIFELWNEPIEKDGYDRGEAFESWVNVAQSCINAIREVGATQPIIFQWLMGCWVNLDYPPPEGEADTLDWVWEANLSDPLENLIYSTHIYRCYGSFHHSEPDYWLAWEYNEIQQAFEYFRFPEVTGMHPLIIGEVGANMDFDGQELEHELTAWNNTLTLLNEMGIHYTAFWWRDIGPFRLHQGSPKFTPTEAGSILIMNLKK